MVARCEGKRPLKLLTKVTLTVGFLAGAFLVSAFTGAAFLTAAFAVVVFLAGAFFGAVFFFYFFFQPLQFPGDFFNTFAALCSNTLWRRHFC